MILPSNSVVQASSLVSFSTRNRRRNHILSLAERARRRLRLLLSHIYLGVQTANPLSNSLHPWSQLLYIFLCLSLPSHTALFNPQVRSSIAYIIRLLFRGSYACYHQFSTSKLSLNPFFIPSLLHVYLPLSLFLWTHYFPTHPFILG